MAEYQSVWEGKQIDDGLGRIINGELDKLVGQAATSAQYAQAAERGVKDALANIPEGETPIINDLVTGGARMPLSAEMGKVLRERLDTYTRPNLLINWYFADPINRRGQMEYTGLGYGVDGLKLENRVSCTRTDKGLQFSFPNNAYGAVYQPCENWASLVGETVTMSFLVEQLSGPGIYSWLYPGSGYAGGIKEINAAGLVSVTITVPSNASQLFVGLQGRNTSSTITVSAAKLELGPVSTLAHKEGDTWVLNDPPPNKAAELIKCQRQLQWWKFTETYQTIPCSGVTGTTVNSVRVVLPVPVQLRTNPSVLFSQNVYVFALNNGAEVWQKIVGVQWVQSYGNTVRIAFTVDTATAVSLPIIGLRIKNTTGDYFGLSAEL